MSEVEDIYPVTPMQAGLVFHCVAENQRGLYVVQMRFDLVGPLDAEALRTSWRATVARHEALRTAVIWDGVTRPVQAVLRTVELPFITHDLRGVDAAAQPDSVADIMRADRMHGYDLAEAPLMRVLLVRMSEERHLMVWSHHHVILDGWSAALVSDEVLDRYARIVRGEPEAVQPLAPSFREYVSWQARRTEPDDDEFWSRELRGYGTPVHLDLDRPTATVSEPDWCDRELIVAPGRLDAWRAAARRNGVTLSTVLQAGWAVLLARHDSQAPHEVVYGVVTAVRDHERPGGDRMVGLCVNTLPMRISLAREQSCQAWLRSIQQTQARTAQHDAVNVARFREWTQLPAGEQLFRYILAIENYPQGTLAADTGVAGVDVRYLGVHEATNYALTAGMPVGAQPRLKLSADARRIPRAHLDGLLRAWAAILDRLASPDCATVGAVLADVGSRTPSSRPAVRPTPAPVDATGGTVLDRFAAQVARQPDAPAVLYGEDTHTYRELDARSLALARRLVALGARPGECVGLVSGRSAALVVAVLGILRAGCAYVPLDPTHPVARHRFIAQDAGVRLVVVDSPERPIDGIDGRVVAVDDDAAGADQNAALPPVAEGQLAYVIYTSGSTGTPKGVLIDHGNVAAMLDSTYRHGQFDERDVWTMCHSYAFDFSVFELWGALAYGGRLLVVPAEISRAPDALHELVRAQGVTVFCQTPSAFGGFITADARSASGVGEALRLVLFGGEDLGTIGLGSWLCRYGERRPRLVNLYGITETTVHTTWHEVTGDTLSTSGTTSRIGAELDGWSVRLLDPALRSVPDNVAGEIFVGGAGLAHGYVGQAGLTAQRFVPDPTTPGARLYRSGDRARRLADGTLEYVGRADAQVKIRGIRIEPGEVESVLAKHPAVERCVVVARRFGPQDLRLVAFVVAAGGPSANDADEAELRAFIQDRLPAAMVPSMVVAVPSLPLTPSGKVDRGALRDVELPSAGRFEGTPARTPTERAVAAAWRSVLGAAHVGVEDNFFDVGGHSLLMFALLQNLRGAGWSWLSMVELFANPTVAAQATLIDAAGSARSGGLAGQQIDEERGDARTSALLNLRAQREGRR
ncbi:hypothetical protein Athai_13570 [Actinocatenispora thailandica]|uniref:Carrier domain-containing protein n=1 Tax=Actinocatenispora thailandica TaxID=227318 RepID=A0A7R7DLD0_9ACTN|nr:non-ribosomal peptide synthetase [Actinocatenispora thailandica]BCJ33854.1 hypothetical protein Athai_13570 [Actinocatenispora thailandica]